MANDISMRIVLSAAQGNTMSVINSVSSSLGSGGLQGALLAVGAAATIGLGIASVQAAGSFQQAMLLNVAHAGLAKDQVNAVTDSLLQMGPAVGQSPTVLAQALYPVLSSLSGITDQSAKTQVSLTELKMASESVAGTTTSVTSVTNAASAAFNAYSLGTNNTSQNISRMNNLFDVMNATVSAGNMQWDSYSRMIGKLSVASHAAGVSFNEENAALATLTNSGYSAQNAGTNLANLFTQLDLKTDSLAKNAKKLGITFDEQKFKSMSLGQQIEYINKATDGNKSEILKLMNNNSTAFKTFEALSGSLKNYKGNLDSLSHSQGSTAQSFATASSGFNSAMSRLQASGQSFLITVGMQLLPILTKVVVAVTPIVTSFTNWLVQSGALKNGLQSLVGGVTNTITTVSNLVNFFRQNQVAGAALVGILAGLTFGIIAFNAGAIIAAATAIPTMVAGFVMWAITAGAAAIATIAATWPILLIIAAVALLAAGIFLLVTHWGQVTAFLQTTWARFTGWLQASLHAVGAFFTSVWNGIVSGLRAAWAFIVSVVQMGIRIVFLAIFGPVLAIGALFVWLYQHNRYFQMLIDAIRNIVSAGLAWLQSAWSASVAWLSGLWAGISKYASQLWSMVTAAIQVEIQTAYNFLVSIWTTASSWLSDRWNQFSTFARNAWQAVSSVFSSIWGTYISGPLSSLWNSFSNWFNNLKSQAVSWGSNIIQGLVDGIRSQIGAAGQAAQDVINNVKNFLGFHSPAKLGPGADLMTWGPGLVQGFSQGMLHALPTLDAAVNVTATHLTPLAAPRSVGSAPRSSTPSQGGRAPVIINVSVSGVIGNKRQVVDWMEKELGHRLRTQSVGSGSSVFF